MDVNSVTFSEYRKLILIGNKEVLDVAIAFHRVADAAIEKHIEYGEILPAYIANASFAAELYLKCLAAETTEKVLFEIGFAKIRQKTSKSVRGHSLIKIFNELPDAVKNELETKYAESKWNLYLTSITEELESWSQQIKGKEKSTFELSRYSYEESLISADDAERLRSLLLFFSESIQYSSSINATSDCDVSH